MTILWWLLYGNIQIKITLKMKLIILESKMIFVDKKE
jgi:hypothetical protein